MEKKTVHIVGKFQEVPTIGSPALIAMSGMEGKVIRTCRVVHCCINSDKTGWAKTKNSFYSVSAGSKEGAK